MNNETIENSEYVEYLIDQCLTYEFEIKKVLAQMATIYTISTHSPLLSRKRLLVFETLIMSNLQYPSALLDGVQKKNHTFAGEPTQLGDENLCLQNKIPKIV